MLQVSSGDPVPNGLGGGFELAGKPIATACSRDGCTADRTVPTGSLDITLAFCWPHLRRQCIERATAKAAPTAAETLKRIVSISAIEAEVRGKPPVLHRATRCERSRFIAENLFAWRSAKFACLPGSSSTTEAIRYALNHQAGLIRLCEYGSIEFDTNAVERAVHPICRNRKNALFASGDDDGAR
ncbi:IS66 family transposase [Dankookia rubra]|uniref:IS66 family transposase n=1 Tax=Dankookia rubra TaxID=1442381 RepID=UPI00140A9930|nr:transposase [Dankookia rubra]